MILNLVSDLRLILKMLFTTVASLLLAGTTLAQTPAGFLPAVEKTLDVYYGTTYISPGLMVKKSSKKKNRLIEKPILIFFNQACRRFRLSESRTRR